jgi:hypothetical protein
MPATSVDTFFACFLMVLLVLSAMAATSRILQPFMFNGRDENTSERWSALSKYILQNLGTPEDWGENRTATPSTFGLARAGSGTPYELDIDKVCRLNNENLYALTYAQAFTALGISDASFKIEVKPVFEVAINLTATFPSHNDTVYQFEIWTMRHGVTVGTELACFIVAESYLDSGYVDASDGRVCVNITLPNTVAGPALLVVIARSLSDSRIASFNGYSFAHNSSPPSSRGAFLRLSPLNYSLDASFIQRHANLSDAHTLAFNYSSTLAQVAGNNESAAYDIPHFLNSCPTVVVVTGHNSTVFFAEWTAYPQIPLQVGADFSTEASLSNVFSCTYLVSIGSSIYECTVWLGGPRE